MAVTGVSLVSGISHDAILAQVERLTSSEILRGSESLCRILRYLAEQAIAHPGAAIKEYQIATEVFGRPPQFDSRLDSTVRVQSGRLRAKLAEYYAAEGQSDRVVIEIPRGAYALAIHERPVPETPAPPPAIQRIDEGTLRSAAATRLAVRLAWGFGFSTLALSAVLLYQFQARPKS